MNIKNINTVYIDILHTHIIYITYTFLITSTFHREDNHL